MALPSASEATLIAVSIPVTGLRPDDQVGPASVLLPAVSTVIGVADRPATDRRDRTNVQVRLKALIGGVETRPVLRPDDAVFVRRYRAVATITRVGGTVDTATVILRPLAALAVIEGLALQSGDTISLSAP